ncbi:uncharacterized protein [Penaeus vannamei]|uniref:uncharacterized protein n=1 Tax=Penaeus vannamei TaxID=6689 RepID=UPI00387F94DC
MGERFSYASARSEFNFPNRTICDWASFCRKVLIFWCFENQSDKIGGSGEIVEIDESKFGKRKYNVGRVIVKAHTNTIERKWREAKIKVPRFCRRTYHFTGYLAKAIFQMKYPAENKRFHQFLLAAARLYPPH